MSEIFGNLSQSTNEIKTHTVDFTSLLPSGGTVTAGTATHTPPGGGTTVAVTCAITSPYVYVTVGPLATLGVNYVDVQATFNDGDISTARLIVDVFYPSVAARSGMVDIITELRGMTEASADDYVVVNQGYWSDKQLQDILDKHAWLLDNEPLTLVPTRKSGGYEYKDYYIGRGNIEKTTGGTAIFKVLDTTGTSVSSALYSVDYNVGKITFATDQVTAVIYNVTCAAYDLNAAAAEVWRKKVSHYASAYDFSSDNHSVKREQLFTHARDQMNYYLGLSGDGVNCISLGRADDIY